MRILLVKLGSIGDIVHTLPALAAIRDALPSAEISWVVENRSSTILKDNLLLDSFIEVDTKALRRWSTSGETLPALRQQFRRLRASSFDIAIDFQGLLKSAVIARLSGARQIFGFTARELREPVSRLLLSKSVPTPPTSHVIRKNLALAAGSLGIDVPQNSEQFKFPIALSRADELEAEKFAYECGGRYAVLNPGGGWVTKLWSPDSFGALADALWANFKMRSIVTVGPGERDLSERVLAASKSGAIRDFSPSLKGLYALCRSAEIYVGGDTGPTHLAVAAGTPIVGLFGPTEWWRNGSPIEADICVERKDIGCRVNCHRRSCSNWICMDIDVRSVL
jgi:heptosyltransferase-1